MYLETLDPIQIIFHQREKRIIVYESSNAGNGSTLLGHDPIILQRVFVKLSNYIQIEITILMLGVIVASLWIYIPSKPPTPSP